MKHFIVLPAKKLLYLFLILLFTGVHAQTVSRDHQASELNSQAREYLGKNPKKAVELCEEGLSLLDENMFTVALWNLYKTLSEAHRISGNFEQAHIYAEKLQKASEHRKEKNEILMDAYLLHASCYEEASEYQKAIDTTEKGQILAKQTQNMAKMMNFSNLSGICNTSLGNYEAALTNYLEGLEKAELINDTEMISIFLSNLSTLNIRIGRFSDALAYNSKGLALSESRKDNRTMITLLMNKAEILYELGNIKEQIPPLEKALKISQSLNNRKQEAICYTNLSDVYLSLEDYDKAVFYSHKAIPIAQSLNQTLVHSIATVNYSTALSKKGKFDLAIPILENVLKSFQDMDRVAETSEMYKILSEVHEDAGHFKTALHYYKQHKKTSDELMDKDKFQVISEIKQHFETEKKEREIQILNLQLEQKEGELKRQALLKNLSAVILFLLVIIFIMFFRNYRHLLNFWKKKHHIGNYRLLDKIASGGMGDVYKVENMMDTSTGYFAMKVIREDLSDSSEQQKRLKHEAIIIDSLEHPNIIKVYERGEENGNNYMVMELIEGRTLKDAIESGVKFRLNTTLNIMLQISDAFRKIHSRNIIHRDLKTENIMLVTEDDDSIQIKLLDFGIAKSTQMTRLTETGKFMGTVLYLSPEQLQNKPLTTASDIFSLGIIFHELLTGKNPFSSGTSVAVMKHILESKPPYIHENNPDIPFKISSLVFNMLNKNPELRPDIETVQMIIRTVCENTDKS